MTREYNAMMFFNTKEEAESFAKKVNSNSWGWMKDSAGKITNWYVDYFNKEWAEKNK